MSEINTAHEVFGFEPDKLAEIMPGGTKVNMFGRNLVVGHSTRKKNILKVDIVEMYHEGKYVGQNSRLALCYYYFTGQLTKV